MHFFFENPFCDTLTNCQKILSHPYTRFGFFKTPKKHCKIGEKQAKKILDRFSAQPWTDFQLKKRQILDRFSALQHIYICSRVSLRPLFRVSCVNMRPPKRRFAAPAFRNHCFCSAKWFFRFRRIDYSQLILFFLCVCFFSCFFKCHFGGHFSRFLRLGKIFVFSRLWRLGS